MARRIRKKTKTSRSRAGNLVEIEEDTGLALIAQKRARRSGSRPRSSEIRAVAAQLRAVLRSKTFVDRDQEAGVIEEARRLVADLGTLLDRQEPRDPLLDLAVDAAHDAIELRSILPHYAVLLGRIQRAKVAYTKSHKLRDVMQALQISTPKGRPKIRHRAALRRYLMLFRRHLRKRPLRTVRSKNEKKLRLLEAQLQALAEVRDEFGYHTGAAALAGLQEVKRTAKTEVDKRRRTGKSASRDISAAAAASLPSRTEVRRKTHPSN